MKLTATTLSAAQLAAGKREQILFDDVIPGFGLRLREGGSRTFVFQYTLGAKQRRMSLGVATETNVNNVRKIAEKLHARVKLGRGRGISRTSQVDLATAHSQQCRLPYAAQVQSRCRSP